MVSKILEKFTAKIFFKKTKFFGLKTYSAEITFTETLKIISVETNIKNLPFKIKEKLDPNFVINWSKENKYTLSFESKNFKLKRLFYFI